MGLMGVFREKGLQREKENLSVENIQLKRRLEGLVKERHDLEQQRIALLNRIEEITRNLMANPTTVVEETGKALVDLLKESNRANREVTADMTNVNRDLQIRLDAAREKIDSLQNFLIIAARKIGIFEGVLRNSPRLELSNDDVFPLVSAWVHYETTMTKRIPG